VRNFLHTGNITTTAQELFCHRNTILNRLNRFQELTGIDLAVPAQAARLVVAWA
jgi:DNA-binding PucR family transcriptional regulator